MSKVDNSKWYALVKYKSGNITEVLPVHKIRVKVGKGQRVAFNPKSLTDFDKTKFYTVNTTHSSEDGKEHKWYAIIGLLADFILGTEDLDGSVLKTARSNVPGL
ncbi:uncharacterized protein LOC112590440 [Harpegnathos saltator]|uniref:uncharacterized protein LOC112590440 n=1 Tax=Harpegnathos saltator TaxID=610380 RepID=UPI000DBEDDAC|nr:uncharacterized protein LOC112590440 [Harpegnathos saltator]XP_025162652.1 uncharacterized protein LOC112590440 [Harpegnathos saltator]XP_025162653.1 uncharacterized protein LOC112590440 [Harpegnathos saltator]